MIRSPDDCKSSHPEHDQRFGIRFRDEIEVISCHRAQLDPWNQAARTVSPSAIDPSETTRA